MKTTSNSEHEHWLNRNRKEILLAVLSAIVCTFILLDALSGEIPEEIKQPQRDSSLYINGIEIPQQFFCGEKLDMTDTLIRRHLTEEFLYITFNQTKDLPINRKAGRWFPIVEPILRKYNVPDDFKYVMVIESGLINDPDQPKAGGFWQLMPPVAQHYGLEITGQVDERFNVQKATEAACQCILDAYEYFKDWPLAFASYDLGIGALENQRAKQPGKDYYHLQLNDETTSYVYRLLAFKALITDPSHYGYEPDPRRILAPVSVRAVTTDTTIKSLALFASKKQVDLRSFRYLNPWLLDTCLLNPEHKNYTLLLPAKGYIIPGMGDFNPDTRDSISTDTLPPRMESIPSK